MVLALCFLPEWIPRKQRTQPCPSHLLEKVQHLSAVWLRTYLPSIKPWILHADRVFHVEKRAEGWRKRGLKGECVNMPVTLLPVPFSLFSLVLPFIYCSSSYLCLWEIQPFFISYKMSMSMSIHVLPFMPFQCKLYTVYWAAESQNQLLHVMCEIQQFL